MNDTTLEVGKKVTFIELGVAGTGAIAVQSDQMARLEEFTERVGSGEFHRQTAGTIPTKCIDGRRSNHTDLQPNSAGGSETLMVADDLTAKRFAAQGDSTLLQYSSTLSHLKDNGHVIGGHTAADLHGAPSGCGANDKLAAIYDYIARNGGAIRDIAAGLGVSVDDATHAMLMTNAARRSDFSDGSELLAALRKTGGEESIDTLKGAHKEVIAVINLRTGTTLDREAVADVFGDVYQAFNVDAWSFGGGARAINPESSADKHAQQIAAMTYYNIATAGVLCGPAMRVIVLK